ncbi:hypothetical protein CRM22_001137 [Opisthorchis felineus]|uniref:Cystatin domain-containing protein n=1 Tax=Opisthorchis felineus TaxID=147828 RepID=A0A4V3SGX9_OPIFE|nr:hypothetical protein CRM22_001137 [Opisthorchis felineus]
MYFTVVFALYLGARVGSMILGGKQPLTEDDLKSKLFQGFVRDAEIECNKVVNSESWFVLEGPVNGTKQVVSGIKYEFSFFQGESDCKKEAMLAEGNKTSCEIKKNGLKHMCSATVVHAPHTGPTVIKVKVVDVSQADVDQDAEEKALESVEVMIVEDEPSMPEPIGEQSQH